jgi:hypothetical protein
MSKTSYLLINPYMEGNFKTTYKANSALKAATKFYKEFDSIVSNSLSNYGFSLYNTDSKEIHNFYVTEDYKPKQQKVNYELREVDTLDSTKGTGKKLYQKYMEQKKMSGGKDSDSSSSDSDSDSFDDYPNMPIRRYFYNYLPYPTVNLHGLTPNDLLQLMKQYYTPSFIFEYSPIIVASFDMLI